MKRTFVIGDVHGHADRLLALLDKAGVTGDDEVVQLGDLGQFDAFSQNDDFEAYTIALERGIIVLWGNHDMAAFRSESGFLGYVRPPYQTIDLMKRVAPRFAHHAHGYLLTHAGVHPNWALHLMQHDNPTAESVAAAIQSDGELLHPCVYAIGISRGGWAPQGGILWRDDREALWDAFPQVYGHSRGNIRRHGQSLCIDVGAKKNDELAGIWLPERRIVAVGPDAEIHEAATKHEVLGL